MRLGCARPRRRCRSPNNGILNLQIMQRGEQMQHLLEASPISSSPTCPKISFLVENILSMHHLGHRGLHKMYNQKKNFRLLFQQRTYVSVDSGEEAPRTEKRIYWSQEEDVRMMSAWLINSTDSTCGADRKNEKYWTDIEATYNETTPSHRARNAKQIKDRFHKMEVWNIVKTEAKWITYNNGLKSARKRAATKGSGNEKEGEDVADIDLDELDEQRTNGANTS